MKKIYSILILCSLILSLLAPITMPAGIRNTSPDVEDEVIPVTAIQAGPEVVTQVKTVETDGYDAVQVGFEDAKPQRVNKPMKKIRMRNYGRPV